MFSDSPRDQQRSACHTVGVTPDLTELQALNETLLQQPQVGLWLLVIIHSSWSCARGLLLIF